MAVLKSGSLGVGFLWQDLRYAVRIFRANLRFTLTVVLSLGLGIGATCAIFSVIYGVLIDPYIYKDARRIIVPTFSEPDSDNRRPSLEYTPADFMELQASSKAFQAVLTAMDVAVSNGPTPVNINVLGASPNFFEFFGTPALLGRTFAPSDVPHQENPPELAVIGYKLWMKQFNGSRDAIGRDLKIRGHAYKVIGVMPLRFGWFDTDAFIPEPILPTNNHHAQVFMRLRAGVSLLSVDAELQAFTNRFAKRTPLQYPQLPFHVHAVPLQNWLLGKFSGKLWILMTAVSALLLIACANVSVLLLSRGETRKAEISLRAALGASAARILQQLLTEALMLASAGCVLGVLLAWQGVPAVLALLPETSLPHESLVNLNFHVLAFTVCISFGAGVLFGLAPARNLLRTTIHSVVQGRGRASTSGKRTLTTRTLLVVTEVALTTVLLSGAATGLRNLVEIYHSNIGYDPKNVAVVDIGWLDSKKQSVETRQVLYQRIEAAVRNIRGVESVAETWGAVPPSIALESPISIAGSSWAGTTVAAGLVSSEYFSTLKTPLVSGRMFSAWDVRQRVAVAVVNLPFARLLEQKGFNPVGTQISVHGLTAKGEGTGSRATEALVFRIIGVSSTVENQAMLQPSLPAIYLPYTYRLTGDVTFLIRTKGSPYTLEKAIQSEIRAFESPNQPVADFDDLQHILIVNALSDPQSGATLLSIFAALAIALAGIGLYSVVSFNLAQRSKEIAIRRALGAQSRQVAAMVLKSTLAMTAAGIALGMIGSITFRNALAFYEQGWRSEDPLTLLSVPALVLLVSLAATLEPLRKAVSISPNEALRS